MAKDNQETYYFRGKFFNTAEEMFQYASEWPKLMLDQQSAQRILDIFSKDIIMNVFLTREYLTNGEFASFINQVFDFAIKNLPPNRLKND